MGIRVSHAYGEHLAVAAADGTEILRYVHRPDSDPFESPKPYAHPVQGLQMTASHLSGQNLRGNSHVHGRGYPALPERVGQTRHDGFPELTVDDDRLANGGAEWARERRGIAVQAVDEEAGTWVLDWSIHLTDTRDEPLLFGSPTTAGRELAGCTGLGRRGPRDVTGGTAFGPDLDGEKMLGSQGPRLAFTAEHDEADAHSTLVFAYAPQNLDERSSSCLRASSSPPAIAFSSPTAPGTARASAHTWRA